MRSINYTIPIQLRQVTARNKIKNMLISSGKVGEQNSDIPGDAYADGNSTIYVEHSLPSANLSELIARELTYMWQRKNLKGDVPAELTEGHAALVIVQYLRFINNGNLVKVPFWL